MQILLSLLLIAFQLYFTNPAHQLHQPKKQTILLPSELVDTIKYSHQNIFGKLPSKRRLALAWAQIALENGQGEKIYNYNLGNIGAVKYQSYYIVAGSKFRTFNGFEEGGETYWKTLRDGCSVVLPIFDSGDVVEAALQLERCGYYRVESDKYIVGMSKLVNKFYKNNFE